MAATFRLVPLLAALLAVSCSQPLWLAPSTESAVTPPGATTTARLSFSLPHDASRSLSVFQATVEPENLVQTIDHYTMILVSASAPQTVTKTISKAEASLVALDGLAAANDWTLEVKAWLDSGESTLIGRFYANGGLSTTPGSLTNLGDLAVAPVAGGGLSSFRIEITDFPAGLVVSPTDFDLWRLDASGEATAVSAGVKASVTLAKSQNLVVVHSGSIATGTYRLVVKPKDAAGQPASLSPLFIVNIFPNLKSTKTLSAATWNQPPVVGTLTAADPVAGWSALVLAWTIDVPNLFSDYEWVWHPGTAGDDLPDAWDFDPSFVSPLARRGVVSPTGGAMPLSRPHWSLTTDGQYQTDLTVSRNWTLYVRGLAANSKSEWIAIPVNLQTLPFPIKITSLEVVSTEGSGNHTLVRTLANPLVGGVLSATVPILNAQSFAAPYDGNSQTVNLTAPWYLAPGDFLSLVSPNGQYRSVGVIGRPSGPGQSVSLTVYQAEKDGTPGYAAFHVPELAILGDNRSTDWTVDPKVDNGSGGFAPRGRILGPKPDITAKPYGNLTVTGYQFVGRSGSPLALDGQELGFMTQADANTPGFSGTLLDTQALSGANSRHIVVRVQYALDDGTFVYGAYSNTADDTFWGQLFPMMTVDQTNRYLVASANWKLSLSGIWHDPQGDNPGPHPLQYRYKQAGDYDFSSWNDLSPPLGAPTDGDYPWSLDIEFAHGAQGEIQFRVSSVADAFVEGDPLDFDGQAPPTPGYMFSGLANGVGKITYLAADHEQDGWFAQGFTGNSENVFLSHWFNGGGHDNTWGGSGSVITSNSYYNPGGIGFVQTAGLAATYRLWVNGYFQNGIGNNQYRSYTSTGSLDNAGIDTVFDLALGRPVIDSAGNIAYLSYYDGGGPNKFWVDKRDSTGTAHLYHWELANTNGQGRDANGRPLTTLAVDENDKILVAGGTRVMRISSGTSGATLDGSFAAGGVFSIELADFGLNQTDIRAVKVRLSNGKIYLLVGGTTQNTLDTISNVQNVATIVRLNANGTLDTVWGGAEGYRNRPGTVVLPSLFSDARAFDIDAGGNIVVVGRTGAGSPYVGRILANGSGPDPSFGVGVANNTHNGFVVLNAGFGGAAESVSIRTTGAIGIGGWVKNSTSETDTTPAVWKY